ncbi:hypothetical protein C8Q79DRAFT_793172 [Trametes meyenii]|nr:hypothetical protein C8Q79DRAFT_793172 [Trametes meyenii]
MVITLPLVFVLGGTALEDVSLCDTHVRGPYHGLPPDTGEHTVANLSARASSMHAFLGPGSQPPHPDARQTSIASRRTRRVTPISEAAPVIPARVATSDAGSLRRRIADQLKCV